jgi:hypothetical protein
MDLFTTSFITKQKLVNNSFAVTGRNYANNFVASNVAATHIFDQYLFREDAIYTSSVPSCTYEEPTFFSNFLRFSALSHSNLTIAFPDNHNHKLDIFGFFITVQLAFKVNHSVILARPNDLAFFCYYNKAFASGGSGISYSFDVNKQLICATKQSRLDYQRKFDSRRQGTFVTNGSQRAVSFFNMVFSKNNNASTSKIKSKTFFLKSFVRPRPFAELSLKMTIVRGFSHKSKSSLSLYFIKRLKKGAYLQLVYLSRLLFSPKVFDFAVRC